MSPRWRWFVLGYLWSLPMTIIGLLLAVIYRAHSWRWHDGTLECIGGTFERRNAVGGVTYVTRIWGRPGAQTHGWLMIFASEAQRERADLRVHERVHVVQAFIGGPLYALAYGVAFAWWAVKLSAEPEELEPLWHRAYERIPFEVDAYRVQREFLDGQRPGAWGSRLISAR